MRLVARFPDKQQVSALVDTLRNEGFDRKDMIISDLAERQEWNNIEDAAKETILIKTERNSLNEIEPFGEGIKGLKGRDGIVVAVKTPKHESDRVRSMMEQSGAIEVAQD